MAKTGFKVPHTLVLLFAMIAVSLDSICLTFW